MTSDAYHGVEFQELPAPTDLFYIQNRGQCGNCLLWWRANRCGYTSNLDEALKLPADEARKLCASRPSEDLMWPAWLIDGLAERHVGHKIEGFRFDPSTLSAEATSRDPFERAADEMEAALQRYEAAVKRAKSVAVELGKENELQIKDLLQPATVYFEEPKIEP